MGGYGSGRRTSKKITVEESLTLCIKWLVRDGVVAPGQWRSGTLAWWYSGADPHARMSYEADAADPTDAWFRVSGRVDDTPVDYRIRLKTTQPNFGGLRWWFVCPCLGRRAAKLHLPPGGTYFAHREAYGLTYRSCQESGQFRVLYRHVAARTGLSEAAVRSHLNRGRLP